MTSDILAAFPELPMPVYSWSLPYDVLNIGVKGLLTSWARVTHAVSLKGETCAGEEVRRAADACRRVNRFNPKIPATIALNFSPYQDATYGPTDWINGVFYDVFAYVEKLKLIRDWAGSVAVSAVLLDHEKWKAHAEAEPWDTQLDQKYDLFHIFAKRVFPEASVFLYGRGESGQHLTGNELGDGTSTRIYTPDDVIGSLGHIRGHRNSTSRQESYGDKISWWLACGWSRNAFDGTLPPAERILPIDIPLDNMRRIGAALAERAPSEPVMFYPSPWDPRVRNAWEIVAAFAEGAGS